MSTKEKERRPATTRRSVETARARTRRPGSAVRSSAKKQDTKKVSPDVVYLPPKPFNRNRLILRLATVVAVVIALILGVSVFFKVDESKIQVSGDVKYSRWDICQASGIKDGDHLLTFSRAQAAGKIIAKLPYVQSVRIGIKLPDTVNIEIVEIDVLYALEGNDGAWWLVSSGGKVVEKAADGAQTGYTRIHGVQLDTPTVGSEAVALENIEPSTDAAGNPIPITVTQSKRLDTAMTIVSYLELNGVIGQVTQVNVSDLGDIQLAYGQQYQVKLGNDTQLSYKVSCMKQAVDKLDSFQRGELDVSFTIWPNQVGFTPFGEDSSSVLEIL